MQAVDLRKGMIVRLDGDLWRVHEFQHVTPGNWRAMMQTRLRNLRTGATVERRFRAQEQVERVQLEAREVEYLYQEGDVFVFMDTGSYEQVRLSQEAIEEALPYLLPNLVLQVDFFEGQPVGIALPGTVDLRVVETEPTLKGATASASYKPAKLETGLTVQVPPFITVDDHVRIDTATGEYLTRA